MKEESIDDHHIFPSDFLQKVKGVDIARLRDCIVNRTLIDAVTNRKISNRAPSDYLKVIRNTAGFPFDAVLESHFLPTGETSPFWTDNFEDFLDWRQKRLSIEIKRVTGLEAATDLELEDSDADVEG